MSLKKYAQHVSTAQHKAKLDSLIKRNVKPVPLKKTLSEQTMGRLKEKNKTLKKEE